MQCGWARDQQTPCNTEDELKAMITTPFANLNEETVGKTCDRSCLEAVVETNGDFFE